jgi:Ca2+-binding RTX toxin-like protein
MKNSLDYMKANNLIVTAWGGGTWWPSSYPMYMGTPGQTDSPYLDLLERHFTPWVEGGATALAPAPVTSTAPTTTTPTTSTAYLSSPTIVGTAGSDSLNGTGGVDRMDGREGNDSLGGSGGADVLSGGAGIDMASYHWSGAGVDVDLTRATQLYGDAHGDTLIGIEQIGGSGQADTLSGDAGANLLDGRGGNDVLNGRGGADVLTGGAGTDRFVFDSAADANGDRITDWGTGDILDFSRLDANANLTGVQGFTLIGSQSFSKVAGQLRTYNDGNNTYVAGDVNGDGVADFTLTLNGLHSSIPGVTPTGTTSLAPAPAPAPTTTTSPTTSPTTSTAYLSSPTIVGTAGSDTLNGTGGVDRMDGREGNDSLSGSGGADVLSGGAGIDMASYHWSGAGVDVDLTRATQLYGDAHGDTLIGIEQVGGSGHADTLRGDAGANLLDGRGGNDVLNGRGGADVLTGGAGADRFVFDSAADANGDRIIDWGTGDILDLRGIDANANLTGVQGFTQIGSQNFSKVAGQLRTFTEGTDTYVAGDVNGDGIADFMISLAGTNHSINWAL